MHELTRRVATAFYGRFTQLRPAQAGAIEPLLRGEDVLIASGTGSGKTEAALAPLIDRYLANDPPADGVRILYLTPTRALANDLSRRLEGPLDALGLRLGLRHGERDDLKRVQTPDVLITTPESLDVLLMRSEPALRDVMAVVIDEIHLLYNMQRGLQVALLLGRLEARLARHLQVCGLSATVADPSALWRFFWPSRALTLVEDPSRRSIESLVRLETAETGIAEILRPVLQAARLKVLLFVDAKRTADQLVLALVKAGLAAEILVHHASLDRDSRLQVEQSFLQASRAVCVATSTLELGIDIGDIDLVVLYGRAPGWQSFLQRIGRGNRRSGVTKVLCVVPSYDPRPEASAIEYLAVLSLIREGRIEAEGPHRLYGAALQQLTSMVAAAQGRFVHRRELTGDLSALPHVTEDVVERLIDEGVEQGLFVEHAVQARVGPGPIAHELEDRWEIWGNFPKRSHQLEVLLDDRALGHIAASNLAKLAVGAVFLFAGRVLEVKRIDLRQVDVVPSPGPVTAEVRYGGGRRPQDVTTLEECLRLLTGPHFDAQNDMHPRSLPAITTAVAKLRRAGLARNVILWTQAGGRFTYLTFAGERINRLLGIWAQGNVQEPSGDLHLHAQRPIDLRLLPPPTELARYLPRAQRSEDDLTVHQQRLPDDLRLQEFSQSFLTSSASLRALDRLRHARLYQVEPAQLRSWVEFST